MPQYGPATGYKRRSGAAQVAMNRAGLDEVQLRMADGLLRLGYEILDDASSHAPRDPEAAAKRGVPMMADTGHCLVFAGGKKVGGEVGATGKPRAMVAPANQVVLGVWFSSRLGHVIEFGTVKQVAHPFLSPAVGRHVGDAKPYVEAALKGRAASAPQRAAIGQLIKLRGAGFNVKPAMGRAQAARKRAEKRA